MTITTIEDLQKFLRHASSAAHSHGRYVLPVIGPVLFNVLVIADEGVPISATSGWYSIYRLRYGGPGVQLHFQCGGVRFKIQHDTTSQCLTLRSRATGRTLVTFLSTDSAAAVEAKLLQGVRMRTATEDEP
jgi:hypothetical protein